jgi:hypothetical protein
LEAVYFNQTKNLPASDFLLKTVEVIMEIDSGDNAQLDEIFCLSGI